jgi:hypothetical protein
VGNEKVGGEGMGEGEGEEEDEWEKEAVGALETRGGVSELDG